MRRWGVGLVVAAGGVVGLATPAVACGGLVGENGTIQLVRTSTLAAYHDGVERYVTSFEFVGEGAEVGSIIPLPDVPTSVERGGDWTLQRLAIEVAPPPLPGPRELAATTAAGGAQVLLETKIDALDITVLRGGGNEVGRWALDHGYFLTPDAPEVLDFYASRSPVFLAARFDASRARALGQQRGDGTPIMVTIPTDQPWVPLRILSLGLDRSEVVDADVFVLTDTKPQLLAGPRGLTLERSGPASRRLLGDLRSDKGMEWLPDSMWLSYLRVEAPAGDLRYDLAMSTRPSVAPTLADAGIRLSQAIPLGAVSPRAGWPWLSVAAIALAGAGVVAVLMLGGVGASRRRSSRQAG